MFEINLAFGASDPIALHVCANNANGLFLASSCNEKEKEKISISNKSQNEFVLERFINATLIFVRSKNKNGNVNIKDFVKKSNERKKKLVQKIVHCLHVPYP